MKNVNNKIIFFIFFISLNLQIKMINSGGVLPETTHKVNNAIFMCKYYRTVNGALVRKGEDAQGIKKFILAEDETDVPGTNVPIYDPSWSPALKILKKKGEAVDFAVETIDLQQIPCKQGGTSSTLGITYTTCDIDRTALDNYVKKCTNILGGEKVQMVLNCTYPYC